ncbi:MAG: NFACT RNA binding domain-containing protein [Tissierellia bacterium]|nr:NFACT RNA binding domain-containing protein [Tissierellia bacterium]
MSLNGVSLRALASELKSVLQGARIDKVYQENRDVSFYVRASNQNLNLKFCFSTDTPTLFLTSEKMDSPKQPPMFCMLLRKYFIGARIQDIYQVGMDRILTFEIKTSADHFDSSILHLNFEIMGKYSNLIIYRPDTKEIIDSLIRVFPDMSSLRLVLPKESYVLPKSEALNLLETDDTILLEAISSDEITPLKKVFYRQIQGFNPEISKEILFQAHLPEEVNMSNLTTEQNETLTEVLLQTFENIRKCRFQPRIYYHQTTPKILSAIPLEYTGLTFKSFDSMLSATKEFYEVRSHRKIQASRTHELSKAVKRKIEALRKTLSIQMQDFEKSKKRESIKIKADLLAANIYKIQKGQTSIEVDNFYSDSQEKMTIALQETLSPKENVQHYYNRYNKLKNTEAILSRRIPTTKNMIHYLQSVLLHLEQAESLDDIHYIKKELMDNHVLKFKSKTKVHIPKSTYKEYKSPSGFDVLVGKNNVQNDALTFKVAHKSDLWFHVRNEPGTHVILRSGNQEAKDIDIQFAATICAKYSGKTAKCDIDYTEVKNVKKIKGQKPGLVTYENFKTITVSPSNK